MCETVPKGRTASLPYDGICGYTLLESMIALSLLLSIVVPLLAHVWRNDSLYDVRRELTGAWLIEREAVIVRTFPHEALPIRRYFPYSEEWTVRIVVTDTDPVHYLMTAECRGKERARARFYGRSDDAP